MSAAALACLRCGARVAPLTPSTDPGRRARTATVPADVAAVPRPSHDEVSQIPSGGETAGVSPTDVPPDAVVSHSTWSAVVLVTGLIAEAAALGWAITAGRLPVPQGWLDVRLTAWIVLHTGACLAVALLAGLTALPSTPIVHRAVWHPLTLASSAFAPALVGPWVLCRVIAGALSSRQSRPAGDATPRPFTTPSRTALLRTVIAPTAGPRTGWVLVQVTIAMIVSAALIWPDPWLREIPDWWRTAIGRIHAAGPVLRWILALWGLVYLLCAAGGTYWESYRDGGIVAWLTPVALLAPLLIYLSTALLTGLGRDVAGPGAISASTALRDSALFWSLPAVYGVFYAVTAWPAMQRHVTLAMLGYVLGLPLALTGWETVRRETHRLDSARRLAALAAGLRQYADVYRELPPPTLNDAAGRPLLSWRVLVLPHVGAADLYGEFRLDEPWDGPHNRELLNRRPDLFLCEETDWHEPAMTRAVVVVGERTLFPPAGGVPVGEILRSDSHTVALLERTDHLELPWTAPRDVAWQHLSQELQPGRDGRPPLAVTIQGDVDNLRPTIAGDGQTESAVARFLRPGAPR